MLALSENFITADDDLETTLSRVTNAAVDLIDGIDYADVLLVLDGEFLSVCVLKICMREALDVGRVGEAMRTIVGTS